MPRDINDVESAAESARFFVQTWAETVLEQVKAARAARTALERAARRLEWAEREGEGSTVELEDEMYDQFRKMWAAEHMLVWSAHQLELWSARLARERREKCRKEDVKLKNLRDALEHLDKADLADEYALAKPVGKETRALRKLPKARILIGWGSRHLFGSVSAGEIESRALAIVESVRAERDAEFEAWVSAAEEQMIQQAIDERLGR